MGRNWKQCLDRVRSELYDTIFWGCGVASCYSGLLVNHLNGDLKRRSNHCLFCLWSIKHVRFPSPRQLYVSQWVFTIYSLQLFMKVHRKVHLYFVDSSFLYWSCLQVEAGGWTTGQRNRKHYLHSWQTNEHTSYTAEEAFYLCNHLIGIWKSIGGIWLAFYDHIMLWRNMVGLKKIEAKWEGPLSCSHCIFESSFYILVFGFFSLLSWNFLL